MIVFWSTPVRILDSIEEVSKLFPSAAENIDFRKLEPEEVAKALKKPWPLRVMYAVRSWWRNLE